MLREHIRLGKLFARWVSEQPGFELVGDAPLATVCFRRLGSGDLDALNQRLLARLNAEGKLFLTGTRLKGRYVLRLSLGHLATREEDVRRAWELIVQAAGRSSGAPSRSAPARPGGPSN